MERRLVAILAADLVDYTRLMRADDAGTLQRLTGLREGVLEPLIADHRGRVVKLMATAYWSSSRASSTPLAAPLRGRRPLMSTRRSSLRTTAFFSVLVSTWET